MKETVWLDGMFGLIVGDALGVPVQFMSRDEIKTCKEGPVKDMRGGGAFGLSAGTWSDDSSMALAAMDSLTEKGKVDLSDIMNKFILWEYDGMYTPYGVAFDEGITCRRAIHEFSKGHDPYKCGVTGEYANGNGALMRILPDCIFLFAKLKAQKLTIDEAIADIHAVAALTHNHLRSNMCCGFYFFCVKSILENEGTLKQRLQKGIDEAVDYYGRDVDNLTQMAYLNRIIDLKKFEKTPESAIKSTGYVIDSIEAAIWCLITTDSYKDCMLKAVNLGDDTDTVAAIAGGLAGLYYGYDNIPQNWLEAIADRHVCEKMCERISKVKV